MLHKNEKKIIINCDTDSGSKHADDKAYKYKQIGTTVLRSNMILMRLIELEYRSVSRGSLVAHYSTVQYFWVYKIEIMKIFR
jgi:hypothetical protein